MGNSKKKQINQLFIEKNDSFEIVSQQKARRVYLWVILIFFPLPMVLVTSLIFGITQKMTSFFIFLAITQTIISIFAVATFKPKIFYRYNANNNLLYYRTIILNKSNEQVFANARNIKLLFVSSQIVGVNRRYLIYQLKGIYKDGNILTLSSFETGSPDNLNQIGKQVSEILKLPFTEATNSKISKIIRKMGSEVLWYIENVKP